MSNREAGFFRKSSDMGFLASASPSSGRAGWGLVHGGALPMSPHLTSLSLSSGRPKAGPLARPASPKTGREASPRRRRHRHHHRHHIIAAVDDLALFVGPDE